MDQGNDDASAMDSGGRKRPEQQRYKPGAFKGKSEPGTVSWYIMPPILASKWNVISKILNCSVF